jgi:glucose/arabinose dehydrogenase
MLHHSFACSSARSACGAANARNSNARTKALGSMALGVMVGALWCLPLQAANSSLHVASVGVQSVSAQNVVVQSSQTLATEKQTFALQTLAQQLKHPWGMAFLPSGELLVTERNGGLVLLDLKGKRTDINGLPAIKAKGQGGLLDVAVDPDFANNQWIYFSYAEPAADGKGASSAKDSTALARARLHNGTLQDIKVLFSQQPKVDSFGHYGGRIVIDASSKTHPNGLIYLTLGERYKRRDDAQTLDNHHGKIVRIQRDGTVPSDNPFVGKRGALPEIFSLGHRNVQGAALHPATGQLWTHEHGPQGGDEINPIAPAVNYGWPVITYGEEYGGGVIGKTHADGLVQPLHYWVPSIAPSGLLFYQHDLIPAWRGHLLLGSLKFGQLVRVELDASQQKVVAQERIMIGKRVRDVEQGPDGAVYLLTDEDNGQVLRLMPQAAVVGAL